MAAVAKRQAVVMTTPVKTKTRSVYSETEKQSLLDNFDLEVDDKTRAFKASLAATLSSFMLRQEAEILKIPRDLRQMKLGDLEAKWGGSWAGTVQRIARGKIEEREKAEKAERDRRREEEEAKGKRKRAEEAASETSSPSRTNKNARRDAAASKRSGPSSAVKRKVGAKTPRSKSSKTLDPSKGPSSLPQNHIFNPALPPTPSFPRQAKRNESFFSANGSPILLADSSDAEEAHGRAISDEEQDDNDDDNDDSDDDLPDPEALEAQLLAKSQAQSSKTPSSSAATRRKLKRGPSLVFRQSLLPQRAKDDSDEGEVELKSIPLSDGRVVSFNPLELDPARIEEEINEGGLTEGEKERVMERVKSEVVKALTEKMERWKVL